MSLTTANTSELNFENVQKFLIQPLQAASTFLAAGPLIIDSANPVRFPKQGPLVTPGGTTPTTPDWIGETEQITFKDVDFSELSLLPSTLKSLKVISKISAEMSRQSIVALDAAVQRVVVNDVAEKLDRQFWGNTGDGVTLPKGLLAQSGTQSIDNAGAAATVDDLIDAWGLALAANVNMSSLKWVMRPEQFVALRKIKETSGSQRPVLAPDVTADGVFRLLGAPVIVTPHLPVYDSADSGTVANESDIVLVDMSQVVVVRDLAPTVTILREKFADTDEIGIKTVARYDVGLANPEAVVKITNTGL